MAITTPRAFKLWDLLLGDWEAGNECTGIMDESHRGRMEVASRVGYSRVGRQAPPLTYRLSALLDVSLAAVVKRDDCDDIGKVNLPKS